MLRWYAGPGGAAPAAAAAGGPADDRGIGAPLLGLLDHLEADLAAAVGMHDPVAAEKRAVGPEALGGGAVAVCQPHPVVIARPVVGSAGYQQTAGAAGAGALRAVAEQRHHPALVLLAGGDRA